MSVIVKTSPLIKQGGSSGGGTDTDFSVVTANADKVLEGYDILDANGELKSGTIPVKTSGDDYITSVDQTHVVSVGYQARRFTIEISPEEQAKIIPENIKEGVTILGVVGTCVEKPSINDSVVVTGITSITNGNLVISGLSDIGTIMRVYVPTTDTSPDDEVIMTYAATDMNLAMGGSASILTTWASRNDGAAKELFLENKSAQASFDGSSLTMVHTEADYINGTAVVIGTPSGNNTKLCNAATTSGSLSESGGTVTISGLNKYTTIKGIYIFSSETVPSDELIAAFGSVELKSGGTATLRCISGNSESVYMVQKKVTELDMSTVTVSFDGSTLTLTASNSDSFVSGSVYTIIGE